MKWLFGICLFLVLAVTPAVYAQEQTGHLLWDLSDVQTVDGLNFQFNYPHGWASDNHSSIVIGETQADVDAMVDGDAATAPTGTVMIVSLVAMDTVKDVLQDDQPTMEDIASMVAQVSGITETHERVMRGVMAQGSTVISGTDSLGRKNLAAIWTQDDKIVALSLNAPPSLSDDDLAYTWGQILDSVQPLHSLEFGDTVFQLPLARWTVTYPKDWVPNNDGSVVYELEDDLKQGTLNGAAVFVGEQALKVLGLADDASVEQLADFNRRNFAIVDPFVTQSAMILDQPAVTIVGSDQNGRWAMITQTIVSGLSITLVLSAPSEEKLTSLEPTWITMLGKIRASDSQM